MIASWSKTIQSVLACGPSILFLPTKQSARPIYSHDNATWKSSIGLNTKVKLVLSNGFHKDDLRRWSFVSLTADFHPNTPDSAISAGEHLHDRAHGPLRSNELVVDDQHDVANAQGSHLLPLSTRLDCRQVPRMNRLQNRSARTWLCRQRRLVNISLSG